jgi:adenylate cyclase, class 2
MKEIEILIEVRDTKERALKALSSFESQGVKKVLDIYFFDPLRPALQIDEQGRLLNSFRLRSKEGACAVAYKVDHFNEEVWSHSDEYETSCGDFDTMCTLLEKLGLKELVRIDNEKYVFTTEDYEIVLEDVKDLGLYLEVEKRGHVDDANIEETKQEIRMFIESLGIECGEEQNAGKPELMLRKGKKAY